MESARYTQSGYLAVPGSRPAAQVRFEYGRRRGGLDLRFNDPRLPYLLAAQIRAGRIADLSLHARDDHSIATVDLRQPSPVALVQSWAPMVEGLIQHQRKGTREPYDVPEEFARDVLGGEGFRPGQRVRGEVRDRLLRVVAAEYRAATTDRLNRAPRQRVRERLLRQGLGYSQAHVNRLIADARADGLLGPAHRGKAGEAR